MQRCHKCSQTHLGLLMYYLNGQMIPMVVKKLTISALFKRKFRQGLVDIFLNVIARLEVLRKTNLCLSQQTKSPINLTAFTGSNQQTIVEPAVPYVKNTCVRKFYTRRNPSSFYACMYELASLFNIGRKSCFSQILWHFHYWSRTHQSTNFQVLKGCRQTGETALPLACWKAESE